MVSISTIYNSEDIKESLTKQSIKQKKNIYIYIYKIRRRWAIRIQIISTTSLQFLHIVLTAVTTRHLYVKYGVNFLVCLWVCNMIADKRKFINNFV